MQWGIKLFRVAAVAAVAIVTATLMLIKSANWPAAAEYYECRE